MDLDELLQAHNCPGTWTISNDFVSDSEWDEGWEDGYCEKVSTWQEASDWFSDMKNVGAGNRLVYVSVCCPDGTRITYSEWSDELEVELPDDDQ